MGLQTLFLILMMMMAVVNRLLCQMAVVVMILRLCFQEVVMNPMAYVILSI